MSLRELIRRTVELLPELSVNDIDFAIDAWNASSMGPWEPAKAAPEFSQEDREFLSKLGVRE